MGRQPNAPSQRRDGSYECWHPGIKRKVNLGQVDYQTALKLQQSFYPQRVSSPTTETVLVPKLEQAPPPSAESRSMSFDFDAEDKPLEAADLLSSWSKSREDKPAEPQTTVKAPEAPTPSLASPSTWFAPSSPAKPVGKKPGLSPEQSAKLASGLKKTVANLNIIIVGAAVDMFGRVPAPLDDDEIQLLQMGWEMYIDEMFAKAKIKPWHLLLAGNVMIAAAMYVGGTPKVKQLPPKDPATVAKSPPQMTMVQPPVKQ
jgi:hypothetical protein